MDRIPPELEKLKIDIQIARTKRKAALDEMVKLNDQIAWLWDLLTGAEKHYLLASNRNHEASRDLSKMTQEVEPMLKEHFRTGEEPTT